MEEAVWYGCSSRWAEGVQRRQRAGCLNIVWRCLVSIAQGQCPAACPSSAGSSADAPSFFAPALFTIATLRLGLPAALHRCAHACVSS